MHDHDEHHDHDKLNDHDKLSVLIRHWIEHNDSHRAEFGKWAHRATEAGLAHAAASIQSAVDDLGNASANLAKALESLESHDG